MRPSLRGVVLLALLSCGKPDSVGANGAPSASASGPEPASASAVPSATGSATATSTSTSTSTATATSTATSAASAKPSSSASAACGDKPLPDCPLKKWMKDNTAPAMAADDYDALASAFDKIATFAPPGYANWASISKDGAAAARAASKDGVKAGCRGCHDQYKKKYKEEMRARPLT